MTWQEFPYEQQNSAPILHQPPLQNLEVRSNRTNFDIYSSVPIDGQASSTSSNILYSTASSSLSDLADYSVANQFDFIEKESISFFQLHSWTEVEKSNFFNALNRYSRFLPEKIAEAIKTKTFFQVTLMLELFFEVSSQYPKLNNQKVPAKFSSIPLSPSESSILTNSNFNNHDSIENDLFSVDGEHYVNCATAKEVFMRQYDGQNFNEETNELFDALIWKLIAKKIYKRSTCPFDNYLVLNETMNEFKSILKKWLHEFIPILIFVMNERRKLVFRNNCGLSFIVDDKDIEVAFEIFNMKKQPGLQSNHCEFSTTFHFKKKRSCKRLKMKKSDEKTSDESNNETDTEDEIQTYNVNNCQPEIQPDSKLDSA